MNTTNKEIKEKEERLLSFRQEVEGLRDISDAEEYAKQLAHLFLGNGLSLQTILLMAIDFGQQHPNWIPVEDEPYPPKKNKWDRKSKEVFIHGIWQGEPKTLTGTYHYDIDDWGVSGVISTITHWMPIVPPRKEEDNE